MVAVISGRDREAFREFYAEYDGRVLRNASAQDGPSSPARSPIPARPSCNTTSPISRRGWRRRRVSGFPAGGGAGERAPQRQERALPRRGELPLRPRRGAAHRIPRHHRCRARPPGRRRVPAVHVRENGAADDAGGIPALGGAARRRAQPRAPGPAARPHALSHLLGQLERAAHVRRAAEGHRRSRAQGRCRRLQFRGGKPAPRA